MAGASKGNETCSGTRRRNSRSSSRDCPELTVDTGEGVLGGQSPREDRVMLSWAVTQQVLWKNRPRPEGRPCRQAGVPSPGLPVTRGPVHLLSFLVRVTFEAMEGLGWQLLKPLGYRVPLSTGSAEGWLVSSVLWDSLPTSPSYPLSLSPSSRLFLQPQ